MNRRALIALSGGVVLAMPFAARAQQQVIPMIGVLSSGSPWAGFSPEPRPPDNNPFHKALSEAGYIDGRNVTFQYRFCENHFDRLPDLASDLVRRQPAVILTVNGTPSALAAKAATSTIPIVFSNVSDPVGAGLVASLARPGGNITGFTNFYATLTPKLVDLLCELVPRAGTIAMLVNPANQMTGPMIRNVQEAARAKGVMLLIENASTGGEIDDAFAAVVQSRAGALIVAPDILFGHWYEKLVALAARHSIPEAFIGIGVAAAGGLMEYGTDDGEELRLAGTYAARILKGAKPADLPVQQPTRFSRLTINLKTAAALGLAVPQSMIARADELIE